MPFDSFGRFAREVTLEIPGRGTAARVRVALGEPFNATPLGERRRTLVLATERSESHGLVEPGISWDAVLAHADMLLALEDESAKGASA